jgi:hypothetical protein
MESSGRQGESGHGDRLRGLGSREDPFAGDGEGDQGCRVSGGGDEKVVVKIGGMVYAMRVGALEIALKKPDGDFRRREMP